MTPRNRTELVALIGEEALTAMENAGCVVMPREVTEEMEAAHYDAHVKSKMVMADVPEIWTAMLSASPYVKEAEK